MDSQSIDINSKVVINSDDWLQNSDVMTVSGDSHYWFHSSYSGKSSYVRTAVVNILPTLLSSGVGCEVAVKQAIEVAELLWEGLKEKGYVN